MTMCRTSRSGDNCFHARLADSAFRSFNNIPGHSSSEHSVGVKLLNTSRMALRRSLVTTVAITSIVLAGCGPAMEPGFGIKKGKPVFVELIGPRHEGHIIVRDVAADPATFALVPPPANATPHAWNYARDSTQVFIGAVSAPYTLIGCDPATFVIMTPDGKYSGDATHVYYCGVPLKNADPKTFQILRRRIQRIQLTRMPVLLRLMY